MTDRWIEREPLREILVAMGKIPPPKRRFSLLEISIGWRVFGNDRELVGRVSGHVDEYLVVERVFHGHFLSFWRMYVPASAIAQTREGAVLLNVPRKWVGSMGWNRPPRRPPAAWRHS